MSDITPLKKLQILNSVEQFCRQYGTTLDPIRNLILLESIKNQENCEEILESLNDKEKKKVKKILELDLNAFELNEETRTKLSNQIQSKIQDEWSNYSFAIIKKIVPIIILIGILYSGGKYLFFPDHWRASYYSNKELSGIPYGVYSEQSPNHQWGVGAPQEGMSVNNFSVRFETTINMRENDTLTFKTLSDDGIRVYVDEEPIIDFWVPQNSVSHEANKELAAGPHSLRIEYYEAENGALINFEIESTKDGSYKLSSPN